MMTVSIVLILLLKVLLLLKLSNAFDEIYILYLIFFLYDSSNAAKVWIITRRHEET